MQSDRGLIRLLFGGVVSPFAFWLTNFVPIKIVVLFLELPFVVPYLGEELNQLVHA